MAGYGISDVPTIELGDEEQNLLTSLGADETQSALMAEAIILTDEWDHVIGPASKIAAHKGTGAYHRAFSVLLFDSKNRLLLQRRASDKVTFPDVWANSCCSHPLHSEEEMDETNAIGVKRAAVRKLEQELGISPNQVPLDAFHFITKMRYSARMNETWTEREIDHILVIQADVDLSPNPNEISETLWVTQSELEAMLIDEDGTAGVIAPWFRCIAARIMNDAWWQAIGDSDALEDLVDEEIHDMGDVSHMLPDAVGADLMTALAEVKPLVEARIERALTHTSHARLSGAMMHLVEGGGKRLRACMPWMVARAVGDSHAGLLDVGAAIETIHNFTLVHDDIMDDDDVRRGRNAVHIEYDLPTAINAGDAMLAIAFEAMAVAEGIEHGMLPFLVKRIGRMVRRVSEGQQLDIDFEGMESVTEEQYIEMITGKTAVMFLTCAEIGAYLSGADEETVQCMHDWGLAVGLCFQLMDDLIDITGDTETLGKPAGSDIVQGKRTLIAIHALQSDSDLTNFNEVFGAGQCSDQALTNAVSELEVSGSIEYAKKRAMHHHSLAHECLDKLEESSSLSVLRELTDFQLIRIS